MPHVPRIKVVLTQGGRPIAIFLEKLNGATLNYPAYANNFI